MQLSGDGMSNNPDLEALMLQRDQIKDRISRIGEMRPGSLVARFRKCGKSSCHCAKKGAKGHGPCYSLTHPVGGKTRTRVMRPGNLGEDVIFFRVDPSRADDLVGLHPIGVP
jgi:hypothetical protein